MKPALLGGVRYQVPSDGENPPAITHAPFRRRLRRDGLRQACGNGLTHDAAPAVCQLYVEDGIRRIAEGRLGNRMREVNTINRQRFHRQRYLATESQRSSLGAQASCSPRRHEDAKNRKGFLRVFVVRFFWLRLGCTVEFVASKTATN